MLRRGIGALIERLGYEVRRQPRDMEPEFHELFAQVRPYTGVSHHRCYALYQAIVHVVRHGIPGAVVECGVARGGSSMLAALTLARLGEERDLYLYDTFTGMTEPGDKDVSVEGTVARNTWREKERGDHNEWMYGPLEMVRENMARTGYPDGRIHYVKGKVEETIPGQAPDSIAVLRLDTDWFESTWHELVHLYPRLSSGGALYVDDYGAWLGAREAVDRYFREHPSPILLNRLDGGARIGTRP